MQNVSKEINTVVRIGNRMTEGIWIGNERRNIVVIRIVKKVVGIVTVTVTGIEIVT